MVNNSKGFSLIELTIVILILAVIIASTVTIGKSQLESDSRTSTQQKMQTIANMLVNFVAINGRLPCPADLSTTPGTTNFGLERISSIANGPQSCVTSANNIYYAVNNLEYQYMGAIPFKTLNLSNDFQYDAWGNKFSYAVQRSFINNDAINTSCQTASNAADNHTDNANICFRAQASGGVNTGNTDILIRQNYGGYNMTRNAVFVIISHGPNGLGAWRDQSSGTSPRNTLPSYTTAMNERDNTNCSANTATCSTTAMADANFSYSSGSTSDASFDDLMLYKSRNQVVYECNAFYQQACTVTFGIDMR